MADWPSIDKPNGISEKIEKIIYRNASEAGYVSTRAKWTSSKKHFALSWDGMYSADKATLETFFNTNQGTTFTWTHPELDTSHTCLFSDDSLEFAHIGAYLDSGGNKKALWSVTVNIEEQQ